jgi:hypothetical protein
VLAGTGFITAMLRQAEVSRAKREAWTAMLEDLVVGQDALEGSVIRVITGPDADSYTALTERCREMRAMLRRMMALPDVTDHRSDLRRHANQVRHCLKPAIKEYEHHYLRISRQALLDEKRLEVQLSEMVKDDAKRALRTGCSAHRASDVFCGTRRSSRRWQPFFGISTSGRSNSGRTARSTAPTRA